MFRHSSGSLHWQMQNEISHHLKLFFYLYPKGFGPTHSHFLSIRKAIPTTICKSYDAPMCDKLKSREIATILVKWQNILNK